MPDDTRSPDEKVAEYSRSKRSLRHLIVFQVKLAADAMRDFLLSPLSVAAYLLDTLTGASPRRSLYLRLMHLGRRSDRIINLFDDHGGDADFTIDRAVSDVEGLIRASRDGGAGSAPGDSEDESGEQKY